MIYVNKIYFVVLFFSFIKYRTMGRTKKPKPSFARMSAARVSKAFNRISTIASSTAFEPVEANNLSTFNHMIGERDLRKFMKEGMSVILLYFFLFNHFLFTLYFPQKLCVGQLTNGYGGK